MKLVVVFVAMILFPDTVFPQSLGVPVEDVIAISKKSAVPIVAREPHWRQDSASQGSAVIVGDAQHIYALTCEHVVAIKDAKGKTLRYLSQILIGLNRDDDSTVFVPARLDSANEFNDFALLRLPSAIMQLPLRLKLIPLSQCLAKADLREGNSVVFIGYPLSIGIGPKNEPVSRTGIIAQLTEGKPYYLIDGFVQHGHSGSPVFLARSTGNQFTRFLVGIARGFPKEYANILQKVALRADTSRTMIINPGFSVINSLDIVLAAIRTVMISKP